MDKREAQEVVNETVNGLAGGYILALRSSRPCQSSAGALFGVRALSPPRASPW